MYKSVETLLVEIPTIRPHKMAVATMQTQTLVLVKITTEDGLAGWGEATTIGGLGYGEESPESVKANIETYFAPLLKSLKIPLPGTTKKEGVFSLVKGLKPL